jgi:hypothetical protein
MNQVVGSKRILSTLIISQQQKITLNYGIEIEAVF